MSNYHTLGLLLAELYSTQSSSRRVVVSVGLNPAYIEFKDNALDNWNNILSEAKNRNRVDDLVAFVSSDYRERAEELRAALQPTTVAAFRLESSIQPRLPSYVNALQQGQQTSTISPIDRWNAPAVVSQGLVPTPVRKFAEPSRELITIGRDRHWDRDEATRDFLLMLTREKTGDEKKDKQQVLVLQGKEAGLDSLVDRFEEMCKRITTTSRPVLYARINLGPLYSDYYSLALAIVDGLSRFAKQHSLDEQQTILAEAYDYVAQVQFKSGVEIPSPVQFAKWLTEKYLARVASNCTLVLLLQGFDMLRDPATSQWLMKTWLTGHAWHVEGMVVLLTGETGLDDIKGQQFVSHHDLPPLNKETLKEWATQSQLYGFEWFTDEEAKIAHEICNGNPEKFRKLLDYTTRLLRVGKLTEDRVDTAPPSESLMNAFPGEQ
jgi:hypothetical protein